MDRSRTIATLLSLGAASIFAVSIYPMARRIGDFNAHASFLNLHAEPIIGRHIKVEGFPQATLTDDPPASPVPGMSAIRLEVSGTSTVIPVKKPPGNIPNLAAYDEWLKVLATYEVVRDDEGAQRRRTGSERLVIVVRRTPEGYDPETWGQVRRDEWLFDFYDITREGKVNHVTRRWPRKSNYGDPEARLQRQAAGGKDIDPAQSAAAKYLLQFEPLKERTPEYFIAMHVIPKLNVPEYKFTDTAFSPKVLGWTLPTSMVSFLVLTGSIVFAFAPRRKSLSREREVQQPAA